MNHKTFPPSPWGNSSKVSVFGLTQGIKHYSNALPQDPLKRALLPTFAGKALVCQCPAHEECHADVFVQASESEVMDCSKISFPKTLQQRCESFAAAPQGFSQSADGGGVHSSGDWLAPRAGIGDPYIKKPQASDCRDPRLHHAAKAAWAVHSRSLFMQDEHNDEIPEATTSFLSAAGLHPDLSILPDQPFRLGLIRHLMCDPDTSLIDTAESGFHTDVFEPIQFSGIWRREQSDARDDLHFKISGHRDSFPSRRRRCQVRSGVPP